MPVTPTKFGRYQVLEELGAGAMGAVFLAHDERLDRRVAVKAIHTVGVGAFQREVFESRFNNEARALAALSHPNIVPVFDMGIEDEVPYLVMEHVAGRSLAERLDVDGPISPAESRALLLQIASALGEAHSRHILHRDIKPANILESDSGGWKLADFGIAHTPGSDLTLTGQFLGSPAYAAPEALQRGEFSPASDVYGLAATVYECLTGEPPFGQRGLLTEGALSDNTEAVHVATKRPDLPADVAGVLMACLLRNPQSRPTPRTLIAAISSPPAATWPAPTLTPQSGRRLAVFGGVTVALLVGVTIGILSADDSAPTQPPTASAATTDPQTDSGVEPPRADEPTTEPPQPFVRSRAAEKHWRKARQKAERGDLRGAIRELNRVLNEDPDDREASALLERVERVQRSAPKHRKRKHRGRGRRRH